MKKNSKILIVIVMLTIPAFVHFGIALRIKRLDLYSDSQTFIKDLMSWQKPLSNGFFDYFWPNFLIYLSPHISLMFLAIIFRLHFSLTVYGLAMINIVLTTYCILLYGGTTIPEPLVGIYYLLAEATFIVIFLMVTRGKKIEGSSLNS